MVLYTIAGRCDGFGSHYLSFITGIAFCEYKQYTYIHTPIRQIEHTSEIDAMNEQFSLAYKH